MLYDLPLMYICIFCRNRFHSKQLNGVIFLIAKISATKCGTKCVFFCVFFTCFPCVLMFFYTDILATCISLYFSKRFLHFLFSVLLLLTKKLVKKKHPKRGRIFYASHKLIVFSLKMPQAKPDNCFLFPNRRVKNTRLHTRIFLL